MGLSSDRIESNRSLHDLGMDSLMAVELALGLEQRFNIQLPAMMLSDAPTVERVTTRIVQKLSDSPEEENSSESTLDQAVKALAKQHGENTSSAEIELVTQDAHKLTKEGTTLIS